MRGDTGYAYLPAVQAEVEFGKYEKRIRQLEKQCEALAAEIDCQRPLVDAACKWSNDYDDGADDDLLLTEVTEYYGRKAAREASKPK